MPGDSLLEARLTDAGVDLVHVFRVLAADHPDVFWLDAGADAAEGWSIVGIGEPDAAGPGHVRIDRDGVADERMPPFRGGWVGWLDYETGARLAGAPAAEPEGGVAWMRVTAGMALDHATGATWELGESLRTRVRGSSSEPEARRNALSDDRSEESKRTPVPASARHTPDEYAALIERCREAIRAGDAYQLCLTTRFTVPGAHDPVETYLRLRSATPAHHGGFVRMGDRALLSASPETFLHAERGRIRTRPIKGTRPRGADPASDAALADELVASPKERAENVMIVDLMRNDLSQVCLPGSIRVDGLWEVESYPAVHQLVSTVSGRAAEGVTARALWAAAFPAGSMTGAPKLSAMTVLHGLEAGRPRGVYSGCFGYVGADGRMDLAMVIRSILITADRADIGAGGGITWGSVALDEVAEVATKAAAPLAALRAGLPDAWRHG